MSTYQFLEIFNDEAGIGFDRWLFHETNHAYLQSPTGWRTFVVEKKDEIVAQVRFHIDHNVALASLKSPFGTIQFKDDLPAEVLFSFIQFCEEELQKTAVDTIVLKNPPTVYAPFQNELLSVSLLNLGYQITSAEVGAVVLVENSFESKIDSWELRKLRQAEESGLTTEELGLGRLEEVYNFILFCREERGQNLSLTFDELKEVVNGFPDRFLLYAVRDKERLVAASICIKINNHILYNFYSAHPKEYDHVSPAVMLVKTLYSYCQGNKINLLDLGTSALDGKPNFGLLDFKLRLGATPTPKYTFQKKLK